MTYKEKRLAVMDSAELAPGEQKAIMADIDGAMELETAVGLTPSALAAIIEDGVTELPSGRHYAVVGITKYGIQCDDGYLLRPEDIGAGWVPGKQGENNKWN